MSETKTVTGFSEFMTLAQLEQVLLQSVFTTIIKISCFLFCKGNFSCSLQIPPPAVQWIQRNNQDWPDKIYCVVVTSTSTQAFILGFCTEIINLRLQCHDYRYSRQNSLPPHISRGRHAELFRLHRCPLQPHYL